MESSGFGLYPSQTSYENTQNNWQMSRLPTSSSSYTMADLVGTDEMKTSSKFKQGNDMTTKLEENGKLLGPRIRKYPRRMLDYQLPAEECLDVEDFERKCEKNKRRASFRAKDSVSSICDVENERDVKLTLGIGGDSNCSNGSHNVDRHPKNRKKTHRRGVQSHKMPKSSNKSLLPGDSFPVKHMSEGACSKSVNAIKKEAVWEWIPFNTEDGLERSQSLKNTEESMMDELKHRELNNLTLEMESSGFGVYPSQTSYENTQKTWQMSHLAASNSSYTMANLVGTDEMKTHLKLKQGNDMTTKMHSSEENGKILGPRIRKHPRRMLDYQLPADVCLDVEDFERKGEKKKRKTSLVSSICDIKHERDVMPTLGIGGDSKCGKGNHKLDRRRKDVKKTLRRGVQSHKLPKRSDKSLFPRDSFPEEHTGEGACSKSVDAIKEEAVWEWIPVNTEDGRSSNGVDSCNPDLSAKKQLQPLKLRLRRTRKTKPDQNVDQSRSEDISNPGTITFENGSQLSEPGNTLVTIPEEHHPLSIVALSEPTDPLSSVALSEPTDPLSIVALSEPTDPLSIVALSEPTDPLSIVALPEPTDYMYPLPLACQRKPVITYAPIAVQALPCFSQAEIMKYRARKLRKTVTDLIVPQDKTQTELLSLHNGSMNSSQSIPNATQGEGTLHASTSLVKKRKKKKSGTSCKSTKFKLNDEVAVMDNVTSIASSQSIPNATQGEGTLHASTSLVKKRKKKKSGTSCKSTKFKVNDEVAVMDNVTTIAVENENSVDLLNEVEADVETGKVVPEVTMEDLMPLEETLDNMAAENLVAISLALDHPLASDSLNWFAKVISSERENDNSNSLDIFESMTLELDVVKPTDYGFWPREEKIEMNGNEKNASLLLAMARRCQTKKRRHKKDFMKDVFPRLALLSKHQVEEDLQAFHVIMGGSGESWQPRAARIGTGKKVSICRGRGKRGSRSTATVVPQPVSPLAIVETDINICSNMMSGQTEEDGVQIEEDEKDDPCLNSSPLVFSEEKIDNVCFHPPADDRFTSTMLT